MNIAVIGGGWAGLSAAVRLRQHGASVTVFEAARTLGGRARRVQSPSLNTSIDNGQHILLGAYTETQALMQELGLDSNALLYREPLAVEAADGSFALRTARLPAPLHLLGAIIGTRGLNVAERWRLITLIQGLKRRNWRTQPEQTVAQWLEHGRQSAHAISLFWQPLCLAALNTPIHQACAQLFARVLQDSLGGPKTACDVLIPRVDLSQLWPEHVEAYAPSDTPGSLSLRCGHAVRQLTGGRSQVELDSVAYDAVVVAGNAPAAYRLLQQLSPTESGARYLAMLSAFEYIPIATLTLQLESAWKLPQPMLLLKEDPARLWFGQWLFDRSAFMRGETPSDTGGNTGGLLNIVISDARTLMSHPQPEAIAAVIAQVQEQGRRFGTMPRVVGHEMIIEKRATFAAVPGLMRPSNRTPWPRVWVAGDWTDTDYPAVLEGAVRSGRDAAKDVLLLLG
ncbi:MAG TPA: hydroxysqualene dehydroxylase HpnE [Candidimonas sp.]|nr:hydroxysqualene dehydroxylase HpnE [Candidimonas sp.]